jgi:molybdopterin molybdotransferase
VESPGCLPMIGTELFARPALLKMQGFTDWSRPTVQARLCETGTGCEATLTGDQGSGVLNSLVQADGLAVIQEEVDHLPAGTEVEVTPLD